MNQAINATKEQDSGVRVEGLEANISRLAICAKVTAQRGTGAVTVALVKLKINVVDRICTVLLEV